MKDKTYKVYVSQRAKSMLGTHIKFLAKINKESAITQKQIIIKSLNSLVHMSQRYPFIQEEFLPINKYHKMFVEKRYIILYQIKDDTVYVDYILDCRKDYSWLVDR